MTDADVNVFVDELKKNNPDKKDDIMVGDFNLVIYTGGDPRELSVPYPFAWDEEEHAFSDLPTLKALGLLPMYQAFYVRC